jgi:hypothetical protein
MFIKKLIAAPLVTKFVDFYGTVRFITILEEYLNNS